MNKSSNAKAYTAAVAQAVMVGFSLLAVKVALESVDPIDLLASRFTIAVISVIVVSLVIGGAKKITFHDFLKIAPYGLVYPIAMFFFQTIGMSHVSTSESGIINALAPIITFIIASIMLHERITQRQMAFMIISVAGVIFINCMNGINTDSYSVFGILMIFLSVVSISLYSVLIKRLSANYSAFTIASGLNIVGFIFFNVISIVRHVSDSSLGELVKPYANMKFVFAIFFLGICCSLVTAVLNAYALKSLPAVSIGLLNNLSTIVSILAGVLILSDAFYWYHAAGILVILFGTICFNFSKETNKKKEESKKIDSSDNGAE